MRDEETSPAHRTAMPDSDTPESVSTPPTLRSDPPQRVRQWWAAAARDEKIRRLLVVSTIAVIVVIVIVIVGTVVSKSGGSNSNSNSSTTQVDPQGSLASISCVDVDNCVAIDTHGNVMTYDGTSWSAPTNLDSNGLSSVSCANRENCVAVDDAGNATVYAGGSWSTPQQVDTTPDALGNGPNGFTSVSCTNMSDLGDACIAVDGAGNAFTFDGTQWTGPVSIEGTLPQGDLMMAVSCGYSECVAIDDQGNATTYSGGSWGNPYALDTGTALENVSCSSDGCVAVDADGYAFTTSADSANGWSNSVPQVTRSGLGAISCYNATHCMAVGTTGAYVLDSGRWSKVMDAVATKSGDQLADQMIAVSYPDPNFGFIAHEGGSISVYAPQ